MIQIEICILRYGLQYNTRHSGVCLNVLQQAIMQHKCTILFVHSLTLHALRIMTKQGAPGAQSPVVRLVRCLQEVLELPEIHCASLSATNVQHYRQQMCNASLASVI